MNHRMNTAHLYVPGHTTRDNDRCDCGPHLFLQLLLYLGVPLAEVGRGELSGQEAGQVLDLGLRAGRCYGCVCRLELGRHCVR